MALFRLGFVKFIYPKRLPCVSSTVSNFKVHCSRSSSFSTLTQKACIYSKISPGFTTRFITKKVAMSSHEAELLVGVVKQDINVYKYRNDQFHRMLTVFGGIQLLFWFNVGYFFYSVPLAHTKKHDKDSSNDDAMLENWTENFSSWISRHQWRVGGACFALGLFAVAFTLLYPLRSVSQLTLLRGGDKLAVTTYALFGRTRKFTVPLDDVSCTRSRASAQGSSVSMKIRGRWLYFMLDTRHGVFIEPKLFDHVIGLKRSLK